MMMLMDESMAQTAPFEDADVETEQTAGPLARAPKGLGEWLFLAPALAFFLAYQIWPIVRVLWLSFTDFQFLSDKPAHLIWFDNYARRCAIRLCGRAWDALRCSPSCSCPERSYCRCCWRF
jgi:hypothetical protein